jgi:transcription antitermination factor NusG
MKLPYVPSADVVAALAEPAATFDTRNAELVPEVTPEWHVIEVWPGVEKRIADELTLRRFGVYVPQVERKWDDRGRMVDCSPTLMFPGYIFVFVWDIDQHRSRIEYLPGVIGLLRNERGIIVSVTDEEIDRVRRVENVFRPVVLPEYTIEVTLPKKKRRKVKRVFKTVTDEIVRTRAGGWVRGEFDDTIMELDSPERNQTLLRALGLCSVAAPKGDVLADGGLE